MISKEQAKLLTAVKDNKIPLGNDFYNSNPLLKSLVEEKFVIYEKEEDDSEHVYMDTPYKEITGYRLTAKGVNMLESYKAQAEQDVKMGIKIPFLGKFLGKIVNWIFHF